MLLETSSLGNGKMEERWVRSDEQCWVGSIEKRSGEQRAQLSVCVAGWGGGGSH